MNSYESTPNAEAPMPTIPEISICAIIAVRNDAHYLTTCCPVSPLRESDVAIIDHESTDGTQDVLNHYRGAPVTLIETLPYFGFFSLTQQLESKRAVIASLDHDWLVHYDADEILEHRDRNLRHILNDIFLIGLESHE